MTTGYTLTALKSLIDPALPLNEGFLRCFHITAPEGTLLNPEPPAACMSRSQVGMLLPEVIFQALAPALPERVIASCGGTPPWSTRFVGEHGGRNFAETYSPRGGLGAGFGRDGVSCMAFPGNVRNLPLETFEEQVPLVCERKEFRSNSAGQGQWRGGWGQEIHLRILDEGPDAATTPVTVNLRGGGRVEWEVGGILGGLPGARGEFELNGHLLRSGKSISLSPGDRLVFRLEGGGGYGSPYKRARDLVAKDIQSGLLSPESAHSIFGYGLPEVSDTTDVAEVGVRST
jgi:N-methylhydantoinase B/oxoprolinase/acetone carboxylase alpha subunit